MCYLVRLLSIYADPCFSFFAFIPIRFPLAATFDPFFKDANNRLLKATKSKQGNIRDTTVGRHPRKKKKKSAAPLGAIGACVTAKKLPVPVDAFPFPASTAGGCSLPLLGGERLSMTNDATKRPCAGAAECLDSD